MGTTPAKHRVIDVICGNPFAAESVILKYTKIEEMKIILRVFFLTMCIVALQLAANQNACAQVEVVKLLPDGFVNEIIASNFNQPVGITFDANGRMFVWERKGKVFIVDNGTTLNPPLLNIRDEVAGYGDLGLLGFALDPDFLSNGHFYLLYTVDRHHLMTYGTPDYDANEDWYREATIGRVTRYTADPSTNFTTTIPGSRKILLGENKKRGFPAYTIRTA